jgi:hypothetical protein
MAHRWVRLVVGLLGLGLLSGRTAGPTPEVVYDVVIRNGRIYDGSGRPPFVGDVAVRGDTIARVGRVGRTRGRLEIDATGLAVAPGFINMLSWATESLIADGRALSDIRQGVTLEVFGEGWSMGPLNDAMKAEMKRQQGDIRYDIEWTTLGEYLEYLVRRGVAPNVASFVGATTVRVHVLGYENRAPTPAELEKMKQLVRQAMEEAPSVSDRPSSMRREPMPARTSSSNWPASPPSTGACTSPISEAKAIASWKPSTRSSPLPGGRVFGPRSTT